MPKGVYKRIKSFPNGVNHHNCKGGQLVSKKYQKIYYKNYYQLNREKIKQNVKNYCELNRDKLSEYRKNYYQLNKEKITKRGKKYRELNKEKIKIRSKKYRELNREKMRNYHVEYGKIYHKEHKEKIRESGKKYRLLNKEKIKEYLKLNQEKIKKQQIEYHKSNSYKEYIKSDRHKKYQKEYMQKYIGAYKKNRMKIDIQYKLSILLRVRLYHALKGQAKNGSAVKDLGCSIEYLIKYLESKFKDGMTWENYGKWHVDHKIPLANFDLTDRKQLLEVCHYSNLQPLWAFDNQSKNSKVL